MTDHPPILTPEQVAYYKQQSRNYAGTVGAIDAFDRVSASHEAFRQRAAEDAATIARLTQERDEAVARALTSERFRREDAGSHLDDQIIHIKRWQKAEAALATLREATTWQPMATAPKDGTFVVCATLGRAIRVLKWDTDSGVWSDGEYDYNCAHWMPLPTPPPEEPDHA